MKDTLDSLETTSALLLLGLMNPKPVTPPRGEPLETLQVDSLEVQLWPCAARLRCSCGRTTALLIDRGDWEASESPYGRYHCHVCQREAQEAKTHAKRLNAWLERSPFTDDQHVVLPKPLQNVRSGNGETTRIKRYVYETFHKVSLNPKQVVLSSCKVENCINPKHLYVAGSSARKVTPEIQEFIEECLRAHQKNQKIATEVLNRFNVKLSVRTISNLKKELRASNVL